MQKSSPRSSHPASPRPAPRHASGSPPQSRLALHSDANNKQTQTDGNMKLKKIADDGAAHRVRTPENAEGAACRGFGQGALGSVPTCAARQLEPNTEVLQQKPNTTQTKNRTRPSAMKNSSPARKSTGSPSNQNDLLPTFAQMKFSLARTYSPKIIVWD